MPAENLSRLPREVVIKVHKSEYAVVGYFDWAQMTFKNMRLTRHFEDKGVTFKERVSPKWISGLPKNFEFAIVNDDGKDSGWKGSITDFNFNMFVAGNLEIGGEGKPNRIIFANESNHTLNDYDLVMATGFGYLAPIDRLRPEILKIKGRRPIIVENLIKSTSSGGAIAPLLFFDETWKCFAQPSKKIGSDLTVVTTVRAPRHAIQNPIQPERKPGISLKAGGLIRLWQSMIAAGRKAENGMISTFVAECGPEFQKPDGFEVMSLFEYVPQGDMPGMAALLPWFLWRFGDEFEKLTPTLVPADVKYDVAVSYGKPMQIAVVRNESWKILIHKGQAFARDGVVISDYTALDFEPSMVQGKLSAVHNLHPVDPNDKRGTSTNATVGLFPVRVFDYENISNLGDWEEVSLTSFWQDHHDAEGQAALFQFLFHLYGEQVVSIGPK